MNKKFLKTAAFTMGLSVMSLPMVACNMNPDNTTPQRTGIINRQNINDTTPYSDTGYQRINTKNNRAKKLPSPIPDSRFGTINFTPLPGVNIGATPAPIITNDMTDMRTKAQNIATQLKSFPEVKDANVMVVGNTALVAFETNRTDADLTNLKDKLTERVKTIDPSVDNVILTEASYARTGIQQLLNDMNNKSINQLTQDFNELVRRISPTLS